ncbi:MAG: 2-succinyl-5-enolpyruvyl-6-hydroxy-3-cyclohexene-1-carboxylic-acid synthase [Chloroflexi bacterium]|nr:MAG: 2-succinyl-5-enolpyruvyl-6-hydroxy-3-cyclohexene-1-carboxylic-acid synthase [Chloroflexota bacterium]MBL1193445.1 2-succinyl-5-enolpyruvyl-6-hydroxy-3-cyclohexene-1-carboxylic-acid synthase [Chloroflexota bacterium]NOH10736.1 2-succinyl-5-enolpyruvyl-6-hydroxy-3-cyclohexene-1-carboxylic-acid synthase [Chloroflexota bacterium]
MKAANKNALWAQTFVDELARQGVEAVCIAPGSRSTPLVFAFAQTENIKVYSHLDERSAAYFALGMSRASGKPVALVCTSGTAAANFFPAVIEANYSEVPLLVLTADRPAELRESGANQTIDQIKLYGDHVRWFTDVAPPEAQPAANMLRYLRTLAARAVATSQGVLPGPVHLNFPFRKPLEPTPVDGDFSPDLDQLNGSDFDKPFVSFECSELSPRDQQVTALTETIQKSRRGLIICGPRCPAGGFPQVVTELAKVTGFPVLADALSGLRFGSHVSGAQNLILGGYESYLGNQYFHELDDPELVLHFGDVLTSKQLNDYLGRQTGMQRVQVSSSGRWRDDTFQTTDFMHVDPSLLCQRLVTALDFGELSEWTGFYQAAEAATWKTLEEWRNKPDFEARTLLDVVEASPDKATLYVASSLPVRHLDQFVRPNEKKLRVFANRGASGIDGTVSSALGAAAASDGPTVLVSGDLAFYHDMNGLLATKRNNIPMTFVVINNDGGGIFHRLPVAEFEPEFTNLFLTPHGLRFEHAAAMYGLDYTLLEKGTELQRQVQQSIANQKGSIIEVLSDSAAYEKERRAFTAAVQEKLQIKQASS